MANSRRRATERMPEHADPLHVEPSEKPARRIGRIQPFELIELYGRLGQVYEERIGDLDATLQPKLLRAIEARQVRPVGSNAWHTFDARIVAATSVFKVA